MARRQSDLADQSRQLIEDLRRRADELEQVDPQGASAMRNAADSGEQRELSRDMEAAAQRVGQNQLRTARKNFSDPVWKEWLSACGDRHEPWADYWQEVRSTFERERESLERERAHLLAHRTRDEYWFAEYFDLPWPRDA